MKKVNKKIILIALIFIFIISIINTTYAISNPDDFKVDPVAKGDNTKWAQLISQILGIITVVGILVAVGGIMIIGIQTIFGSASEKAIYKQKMLPFIIGLVILISITSIVSIIEKLSTGNDESPQQPSHTDPFDDNPQVAP